MKLKTKLLLFLLIAFGTMRSAAQTAGPNGNFRFALAGDSIIERKFSVFDDPLFLKMIDRIRTADAAFTNFEMLVHNYEAPGAVMSGGTYMQAGPFVIDEL